MKRFLHIDFLRATAMLAVIVIHVFSDNITNPLHFFIWNYLHFIIVAFIFCSGYVMYAFSSSKITNVATTFVWYKKRLTRLLLPFYWYLLIHYALMFFFPRYFSGLGLQFSWKFFIDSVTLVSGISLNWLPLLFLQLALLFPVLILFFKKKRMLFWVYVCLASLFTLFCTIWQFPYAYYRFVMWIPWSLVFVLPWYFYTKEQKKISVLPYLILSIGGLVGFIVLFVLWQHIGRSVTLIDNKYPPNLFYISYEMFGSFALTICGLLFFIQQRWLTPIYQLLSKLSYSLFFIHYIALDFILSLQKMFSLHLSVWWQVCFVIGASILIAWVVQKLQNHIRWLS